MCLPSAACCLVPRCRCRVPRTWYSIIFGTEPRTLVSWYPGIWSGILTISVWHMLPDTPCDTASFPLLLAMPTGIFGYPCPGILGSWVLLLGTKYEMRAIFRENHSQSQSKLTRITFNSAASPVSLPPSLCSRPQTYHHAAGTPRHTIHNSPLPPPPAPLQKTSSTRVHPRRRLPRCSRSWRLLPSRRSAASGSARVEGCAMRLCGMDPLRCGLPRRRGARLGETVRPQAAATSQPYPARDALCCYRD